MSSGRQQNGGSETESFLLHTNRGRGCVSDFLRSVVYGGLSECIRSFAQMSFFVFGGASTLHVIALGVIFSIMELVAFIRNLNKLEKGTNVTSEEQEEDSYEELLGNRQKFGLHATVSIVSFFLFGLIPPLVYLFSFSESDDKIMKIASALGASLLCIFVLSGFGVCARNRPESFLGMVENHVDRAIKSSALYLIVAKLLPKLLKNEDAEQPRSKTTVQVVVKDTEQPRSKPAVDVQPTTRFPTQYSGYERDKSDGVSDYSRQTDADVITSLYKESDNQEYLNMKLELYRYLQERHAKHEQDLINLLSYRFPAESSNAEHVISNLDQDIEGEQNVFPIRPKFALSRPNKPRIVCAPCTCFSFISTGFVFLSRKLGNVFNRFGVRREEDGMGSWEETGTEPVPSPNQETEEVGVEILRSIVFGGLPQCITNLGVVSCAAGSGVSTWNIMSLAIAGVMAGVIAICYSIQKLKKDDQEDRIQELLGRRQNLRQHAVVLVLSLVLFGLIPPLCFLLFDDRNCELLSAFAASLFCILLLAVGKVWVQKTPKSYVKTVIFVWGIAICFSGIAFVISYLIGESLKFIDRYEHLLPGLSSVL